MKSHSCNSWGYSSVAEHSTADREVAGSTPAVPWRVFINVQWRIMFHCFVSLTQLKTWGPSCKCIVKLSLSSQGLVQKSLKDYKADNWSCTFKKIVTWLQCSLRNQNYAPPGNRTRVARMGILHDTTTPAALYGDAGDRTRGLSHAKRTLYHWATSPNFHYGPTLQSLYANR